ncbi:hypothetical protein ABVT39_022281 [Epinephelus coioides]
MAAGPHQLACASEQLQVCSEDELTDTPRWARSIAFQLKQIREDFDTKMDSVAESISSLNKDTRAMLNRLSNEERLIRELEDKVEISTELSQTTKQIQMLHRKVDDMENRSRRNNLRLVRLKEGMEADDMYGALDKILHYILDQPNDQLAPEMDRVHRTPRPMPNPDQPPRPIILRLLRWRDKQDIIRAATRKQLTWGGQRFSVYQDFSAEESRRRAQYNDVKKRLHKAGVRFGIVYPGSLIVSINGEKLTYTSPKDAEKDLKKKPLPEFF